MAIYNVKTSNYPYGFQIKVFESSVRYDDIKIPNFSARPENSKPLLGLVNLSELTEEQQVKLAVKQAELKEHSERVSLSRTKNNIYRYSRSNDWEYFITLTFDPKKIDSKNYSLVLSKVTKWLNNLRSRYSPDLRYLFVPEYHSDKEKLHFHGLISNVGNLPFIDSGKVCLGKRIYDKDKMPLGTTIYNLPLWGLGWSTATAVRDKEKASSYITKYITKDLFMLDCGKRRFIHSRNLTCVHEKIFNCDFYKLDDLLAKNGDRIVHMKKISVKYVGDIRYIEIEKGDKQDAET